MNEHNEIYGPRPLAGIPEEDRQRLEEVLDAERELGLDFARRQIDELYEKARKEFDASRNS